jgi:hypothetical protein
MASAHSSMASQVRPMLPESQMHLRVLREVGTQLPFVPQTPSEHVPNKLSHSSP